MALAEAVRKRVVFGAVLLGGGGVTYLVLRPTMETPAHALVVVLVFIVGGLINMWFHAYGPGNWWRWEAWKQAWRDARGADTDDTR